MSLEWPVNILVLQAPQAGGSGERLPQAWQSAARAAEGRDGSPTLPPTPVPMWDPGPSPHSLRPSLKGGDREE